MKEAFGPFLFLPFIYPYLLAVTFWHDRGKMLQYKKNEKEGNRKYIFGH